VPVLRLPPREDQVNAAGTPGRPPGLTREQMQEVISHRRRGLTFGQIAIRLNKDEVPTPGNGRCWSRQSVHRLLGTRYARGIDDDMP
jgi:hypothetical protein